jgi:glutathione S-transferase
MKYKNIAFESVLMSPSVQMEVLIPKVGLPIVPVLVTPSNEYIQDSEDIINYLEEKHQNEDECITPKTPKQLLASQLLQLYGDQYMTIPGKI